MSGQPVAKTGPVRNLLLLWLAALLSGCVDMDTLVQVRADGSGRVTERVLISNRLLAPLRAIEGLGGAPQQGGQGPFKVFDEEKLAARARTMGEGVRLIDAVAQHTDEAEGYVVHYAFDDVSALRINQNPGKLAPLPKAGNARDLDKEEFITFGFTPGDPAELTVFFPRPNPMARKDEPSAGQKPQPDPQAVEALKAMLQTLFKGLRVAVAVAVEGVVLDTDATHHDDRRVTLLELDFENLLSAPDYLDELADRRPKSLEEMKGLLKDFPGIKIELAPEIHIRFRDYGLRAI